MPQTLEDFAHLLSDRLAKIGLVPPRVGSLRLLLREVFSASLRAEEGKPIRCSVSFADPRHPHYLNLASVRVDRPDFSKLKSRQRLTAGNLIKLGRAVDPWAGSIAVFAGADGQPFIWGFVDQRIQFNTWMYAETIGRPIQKDTYGQQPGLITLEIDGIAQLSAYHETAFLGTFRYDSIIKHHTDALAAGQVASKVIPSLKPIVANIRRHLPGSARSEDALLSDLLARWQASVRRICVGIQRAATGGALLLSPNARWEALDGRRVSYARMSDVLPCSLLEDEYFRCVQFNVTPGEPIPWDVYEKYVQASEDTRDRQEELTSAVRVIGGLARLDGAVVLTPNLSVESFGTKIGSGGRVDAVYDGASLSKPSWHKKDIAHLGTRHLSALKYCKEDAASLAIVVSQDGPVRVITSVDGELAMWDDVKVRNSEPEWRQLREFYDSVIAFEDYPERRGFTELPKSARALSRGKYEGNLK